MSASAAERLNRYLARRGVASRRGADALIAAGRVTVNGTVGRLGDVVSPDRDRVRVDGGEVGGAGPVVTLALNKPRGVVTTRLDPQRRPTVMQLVGATPGLVPIGRLDADSRGLLLLTNDGELAHRVAHPRFGVRKRYRVTVEPTPTPGQIEQLVAGVELEEGRARAAEAHRGRGGDEIDVVMTEGRRREVRRMCEALGLRVVDLERTAVGPIRLGELRQGEARPLRADEARMLRRAVGLAAGDDGA